MNVAIIGAGPVGLHAALRLSDAGHRVVVLEAGLTAAGVRSWQHVRLFTPWSMLTTAYGRERIEADLDLQSLPTGAEFVRDYLAPISALVDVRAQHRVVHVARYDERKGTHIGSDDRTRDAFRLLVETPDGEEIFIADAVIDSSGVLSDPAPAGVGGMPAPGERAAHNAGRVRYGPVRVDDLAGKRVVLVGDGASAATVLTGLAELTPAASITWVTAHPQGLGFHSDHDDPLPGRRALYERALQVAADVDHAPKQWVERMALTDNGVAVTLAGRDAPVVADAVVSCTGFRPDLTLHRELQIHSCYASEGPMKLAAALLGDAGGDCLAPKASGPELLQNPEPNFYVLGAKSYGRRNDFLLRNGYTQVEEVLTLLAR